MQHDRSIWLKARDGDDDYEQERASILREVQNLACAILAGIQPDKMRNMEGFDDDGMIQRFALIPIRRRAEQDVAPSPAQKRALEEMYRGIDKIQPDPQRPFRLTPKGTKRYWHSPTRCRVPEGREPSKAFGTFLGKKPEGFAKWTCCSTWPTMPSKAMRSPG